MAALAAALAAREGSDKIGTDAAAPMMPISARYKRSETGAARDAADGTIEHSIPMPMPHHIMAMTTGPAAMEARMPANCR